MNIYKVNDIKELIEGNAYVGRGIVIGIEYWWSYLLSVLLSPFMLIPLIGTALTIALAIAMIACGIRRLHDAGYAGTYILLSFIPLVGGIIMIIFYAKESVPDNQWGPAAPGTVSKL